MSDTRKLLGIPGKEEEEERWRALKWETGRAFADLPEGQVHADREFAMKNWRFEKAKAKPKLTREELSMIRSDAGKQGGRPVTDKPKKANGKQNKSKTKQIEKKEEGRRK